MNRACHRIAELHFVVFDAVAAQQRATGFVDLLCAAPEDLGQIVQIALRRPSQNRQRRYRLAAHGIYITQCIGGRDRAEVYASSTIGVKKSTVCTKAHSGVSLYTPASSDGIKPNQHVFVRPARDPGEHLVQNLWTQFGGSTGRGGLGGQIGFW